MHQTVSVSNGVVGFTAARVLRGDGGVLGCGEVTAVERYAGVEAAFDAIFGGGWAESVVRVARF